MSPEKEQTIKDFREWLIALDFNFKEKANGHFQIFDFNTGKLAFQVWATTEKMVDNPQLTANQHHWVALSTIMLVLQGWKGGQK
jgi:hypothetical protein